MQSPLFDRYDDLLKLYALDLPYSEIAYRLGPSFSKNMVVGFCRRLRQAGRIPDRDVDKERRALIRDKDRSRASPARRRREAASNEAVSSAAAHAPLPVVGAEPPRAAPRPRPVRECQWITQNKAAARSWLTCNAPCTRGVYCAEHAALVFASHKPVQNPTPFYSGRS